MVKDYIEYFVPRITDIDGFVLEALYYDNSKHKLYEKYGTVSQKEKNKKSKLQTSQIIINYCDGITFEKELRRLIVTGKDIIVLDARNSPLIKDICKKNNIQQEKIPVYKDELLSLFKMVANPISEFIIIDQSVQIYNISQLETVLNLFLDKPIANEELDVSESKSVKNKIIYDESCWNNRIDYRCFEFEHENLEIQDKIRLLIKESPAYYEIPKFPHMGLQEIIDIKNKLFLESNRTAVFVWLALYNDCFGNFTSKFIKKMIKCNSFDEVYLIICRQMA